MLLEVVKRLKDLPCVIGYGTMNEPNMGWIGLEDLDSYDWKLTLEPCASGAVALVPARVFSPRQVNLTSRRLAAHLSGELKAHGRGHVAPLCRAWHWVLASLSKSRCAFPNT